MADSWLRSALTSFAEPSFKELIRLSVKSNRNVNTLALEPSVDAVDRNVVSALSRSLIALSTFESSPQLLAATAIDRPDASEATPDTVKVELPSSLKVTFRLAGEALSRLVPL